MNLKSIFPGLIILLFPWSIKAQVITTEPAIPMASEAISIYFDASKGSAGLKDYTGDIYAHTGVLTEESSATSDWKYVKADWEENTEEAKLTRISANQYSLEIGPSIRAYYGIPENVQITHLAFVFRNEDGSISGKDDGDKDIFVEVFEEGLNVSIISPKSTQIIMPGTQVSFEAAASETAEISLYLNNDLVKSLNSSALTHTFTFDTPGDFYIKVLANNAEESDADSVFVHVLETLAEGSLPDGIQNGINYIDDNTVQLVLHAPGKEHVFAIGDFNNWTPSSTYRMIKAGDKFWLNIDQLIPAKEYAFQYLVDGTLRIADPYTDKVLDPNNDKWISDNTYPDLIDYPSGQTSSNTSVLQTAQIPYEWKHADYTPPSKESLVIYELLLRDFLAAHDWNTLTDTLDYLDRLGINAIELMPFNEFEGNESWGYNPSFYFAPDKYYGPKNDLKAFIDSCHSRDIAVIMDMVLNHSFSQSPLVQLYYNSATGKVTSENPWYNVDSPNQSYSWGFDFNHESIYTKEFVDRVNSYWLTEYDLDGFRFDFTKGFTNTPGDGWAYDAARIQILKRMADSIWSVNPDAFVILEHLSENSEETILSNHGLLLWGNMNYNYNEASMGWLDGNKSDFSGVSYKKRGWSDPHLVGYMESHDEERLMFKNLEYGNALGIYNIQRITIALQRMELAGAFFFTIPGPKMIWQFGELGYEYSIDFNGRVGNKPIRWDYQDDWHRQKLYNIWSDLIKLKTSEPAFSTDNFNLSLSSKVKRIELNHADMDVRIIGNFDVTAQEIDPNFSNTGYWYDYFANDSLEVSDVNELLSLQPGEYRIYTTKRLGTPSLTAALKPAEGLVAELDVFPVPANDMLYLRSSLQIRDLAVYDIQGRVIFKKDVGLEETAIDIQSFAAGIYFIRTINENGSPNTTKFIKE